MRRAGRACYIPLTHKAGGSDDLFGSDALAEGQLGLQEALDTLKPVLEDPVDPSRSDRISSMMPRFSQITTSTSPRSTTRC